MEGIGGIRGLWNSMVQRMWPLRFWRRIWRGYLVDRGKVMEEIVKRILTKSQIFLFFSIRIKFKVMRLYWRTFKEEEKKKRKATIEENGSLETLHGTRRASFRILL